MVKESSPIVLDASKVAGDYSSNGGIADNVGGRTANASTAMVMEMVAQIELGSGSLATMVYSSRPRQTVASQDLSVVWIGSPDDSEGVEVVSGGNRDRGRPESGPKDYGVRR